ncbi:MAG: acyl-CoA dehydrogenase [Cytophagales bacterium]|nr:acyl-CoA dehydrogenase [Cytophagales bacterium]MCA6367981.1 acyl-CoA dehydrogenase [Cytophagales bacterium]MCA6371534.1 acyl-CoA dehydrogenase [Cytophagales bacterium]MCA6384384.1 acyl-CoA dehydrogenase [Cytophagales bacterium]
MRYTSIEHTKFLLQEVHHVSDVFALPHFSHLNWEEAWMMIESAKLLADRDMAPYFKAMDAEPAQYDGNGGVKTHPQLKTIIRQAAENGWIGGGSKFEFGGMQLPMMIFNAAQHIFMSANNSSQGYFSLSAGAAALITSFGTSEQVKKFVPKIFAGDWQGTMALTEPQAGSSLTDITTSATSVGDGFYNIKGQKIFISGGQHEACDNFVHLTLARIEGAPPGVKGISLFIIPKYWPEENGSLTPNDVFCAGDFQKMGQRGYCTTHLVFGDKDQCRGWLVGEPHKGLGYMFQMMNEARISVGLGAASTAMAAYQASLQYANERPQGRLANEKDPLKPPTLIVNHPDVQRMLLTQKAIIEGALSLVMECNRLSDIAHAGEGEEKQNSFLLLELLTPIVKTYSSEQGSRAVALAIQTLGGYGFTMDFPVQQHYRDIKITTLYEGTTGIQSIDLLGRKVVMEKGKALHILMDSIHRAIAQASTYDVLKPYATELTIELNRVNEVLKHLSQFAQQGDINRYLADATVFMEQLSYVVLAWQWLKQATVAHIAIQTGNFANQTAEFYEGKVHTMKFFFRYELPHAAACSKTLLDPEYLTNIKNKEVLA